MEPVNLKDFARCEGCGRGYTPKDAPEGMPCPNPHCAKAGDSRGSSRWYVEETPKAAARLEDGGPRLVEPRRVRTFERNRLAIPGRFGWGWREA